MVICLDLSKYQTRRRRAVPSSLPNLMATPYMMEQLVCAIYGYTDDDIRNIKVMKESCADAIKGNLSDSGRIRVTIVLENGETCTKHWFVKIMPPNSQEHSEFNVFLNEIEFYRKILPEMQEFVRAHGLEPELGDFDVPEILYSKADEDGAILVLEDIISDGYCHKRDHNGDKFLTIEQAMTAVASIARLHAVSVAMQVQKHVDLGREHPSLVESGLMWTQAEMSARLSVMKDQYIEMLKKSSELDSPTLLNRFRKTFDSQERLNELCQKRCKNNKVNEVLSLQHGDFHFNNLLFKPAADGKLRVKICDWQLTYTGKQTGDLSYLLMSSLSAENREEHEESIKEEYSKAYFETLQKFEIAKNIPKTPLEKEYQETLPFSFFLSCGNIMANESQDRSVRFSYDMCKEAVSKFII